MDNEIWKDIPGFEGLYQVSSFGRVKGVERLVNNCGKTKSVVKEKILSPAIDKNGYLRVILSRGGKTKNKGVNRLVLISFKGEPANINDVAMHINDIVSDNRPCNLKWGSQSENTLDAFTKGRRKIGRDHPRSRPVIKMDLNGNDLKKYHSITAAAKDFDKGRVSSIWMVCHGKMDTSLGYKWKFAS